MKRKLIIVAIILRLLMPLEIAIMNARLWYIRNKREA